MNSKLPSGLLISLFQKAYGCDFDHAAVVVLDHIGRPFVLESSFHGGYTLTPYSKRILEANASQIVLLPLNSIEGKDDIANRTNNCWNSAQNKVSSSKYFTDNESFGLLRGLILPEYIRKALLWYSSPSCKLVSSFLQELGYDTENIIGKHSISIIPDDFLELASSDSVHNKSPRRKKEKNKLSISIFGPVVVVRNI